MATLKLDNLDPALESDLRRLAEAHGRSVEDEVRAILREAMESAASSDRRAAPCVEKGLGTEIVELFSGIGLEQDIPELRGHPATPADFDA